MVIFKKMVKGYWVKSLANGNMLVEIEYHNGIPGGLTRIAIAEEIGALLVRACKPKRRVKDGEDLRRKA